METKPNKKTCKYSPTDLITICHRVEAVPDNMGERTLNTYYHGLNTEIGYKNCI